MKMNKKVSIVGTDPFTIKMSYNEQLKIYVNRLTLSQFLVASPFLIVIVFSVFLCIRSIHLPTKWTLGSVVLVVVIITFIFLFCFYIAEMLISIVYEFTRDKVVKRCSFAGFAWCKTFKKDDIKDLKIIKTTHFFGSINYVLIIKFTSGATEKLYSKNNLEETMEIKNQVENFMRKLDSTHQP